MPAVIWLLAFFLFPISFAFYLSFHDWDLLNPPRYVGLGNYERMLNDVVLHRSVANTFAYVIGVAIPIWVLSLGFALWFTQRFRGRTGYLVIFLMAALIGQLPSLLAWKVLLHPDFGLFNQIFLAGARVPWLLDPQLAMPAIILVSLSTGIPYYAIFIYGAVQSIPTDYFDVARIEGANLIERIRYVILPSIKPVMVFVVLVSVITAFQYLAPFFILTRGGPVDATRVVSLHIWQTAFDFYHFGYAAAMGVVLLIIVGTIAIIQYRFLGREVQY